MGGPHSRDEALRKARSFFKRKGSRSIGKDVRDVFGSVWDVGYSAVADVMAKHAAASQFVLEADSVSVVTPTGTKKYLFSEAKSMSIEGDKAEIAFKQGSLVIRPFAYVVAGKVKAPIGWLRNEIEVPYPFILEELAARCGVEPTYE